MASTNNMQRRNAVDMYGAAAASQTGSSQQAVDDMDLVADFELDTPPPGTGRHSENGRGTDDDGCCSRNSRDDNMPSMRRPFHNVLGLREPPGKTQRPFPSHASHRSNGRSDRGGRQEPRAGVSMQARHLAHGGHAFVGNRYDDDDCTLFSFLEESETPHNKRKISNVSDAQHEPFGFFQQGNHPEGNTVPEHRSHNLVCSFLRLHPVNVIYPNCSAPTVTCLKNLQTCPGMAPRGGSTFWRLRRVF